MEVTRRNIDQVDYDRLNYNVNRRRQSNSIRRKFAWLLATTHLSLFVISIPISALRPELMGRIAELIPAAQYIFPFLCWKGIFMTGLLCAGILLLPGRVKLLWYWIKNIGRKVKSTAGGIRITARRPQEYIFLQVWDHRRRTQFQLDLSSCECQVLALDGYPLMAVKYNPGRRKAYLSHRHALKATISTDSTRSCPLDDDTIEMAVVTIRF